MDLTFALLLVEPSRYHARLIERTLHQRCPDGRIVTVPSARAAISELSARCYDIAIIDYDLEEFDGIELLQLIRREAAELPVILLSAHKCEQVASEAINYGAYDFLTKDDTYHLVLPRIIQDSLRRASLVRKNRELEDRLRSQDQVDGIALASATLAHEINNPLMTILGVTDLLSQCPAFADPSSREKLRVIEESARRIRSAVLKLSRMSEPEVVHTAGGLLLEASSRSNRD
ncbi:MAG: response regulator [bacterium]|nr:response regulator [bacterium]